jgi:hypothetical protein
VTLYRKVGGDYAKILMSTMMKGTSFVDRGFISTSTSEGMWSGELQMVIKCPKGSKGAAIKRLSSHPGEHEVLLARNSILVVEEYNAGAKRMTVRLDQSHL